MSNLNKALLFLNVAAIAALIAVVTVYAWNGPGAVPPTGGGALGAATGAASSTIYIDASSRVGIGTTVPGYKLDVVSGGATTARLGTASTDTVIVGGGAGKIDVGTVDPIYTIGGSRYATYLPGMTGVKEETTGVVNVKCQMSDVRCEYMIDFSKVERGSDLWLFYQVTDFGANWEKLVALLTPNFDGRVWYEKRPQEKKLVIFGHPTSENCRNIGDVGCPRVEVSYRLTAPRFDHQQWLNALDTDAAGPEGFVLNEKQ